MQGLRGQNLNDDSAAAAGVNMLVVDMEVRGGGSSSSSSIAVVVVGFVNYDGLMVVPATGKSNSSATSTTKKIP